MESPDSFAFSLELSLSGAFKLILFKMILLIRDGCVEAPMHQYSKEKTITI